VFYIRNVAKKVVMRNTKIYKEIKKIGYLNFSTTASISVVPNLGRISLGGNLDISGGFGF